MNKHSVFDPMASRNTMTRDQPENVTRMLQAFSNHAERLLEDDPKGRNADIEQRVHEQIFAAWEHNQRKPIESKQTTFLRDYFNAFREVQLACQHLDITHYFINKTLSDDTIDDTAKAIIYWSESYLNDIYVFKERISVFLTFTERKYSKDPDFAKPTREICTRVKALILEKLDPLLKIRGEHVHESRSVHSDPELIRLSHLNLLVKHLGQAELATELEKATEEAKQWLLQQIEFFTDLSWTLFNSTCHVLGEGIITDNGWLIVPTNLKD